MKAETALRTVHEATFIPFLALKGKEGAVADLLSKAAGMVRMTEPDTLQWLALKQEADRFAIADFFSDSKGRDLHFAGQVAAALKDASGTTLEGGWDKGVVANVENAKVMASVVRSGDPRPARLAVRIEMQAKPGKEEGLAQLLIGAAALVEAGEPDTLLWYAIRLGTSRFAIFDVFPGNEAMAMHFSGKVAAALKGKAQELVEGGWEDGVASNIRTYQVLSGTW